MGLTNQVTNMLRIWQERQHLVHAQHDGADAARSPQVCEARLLEDSGPLVGVLCALPEALLHHLEAVEPALDHEDQVDRKRVVLGEKVIERVEIGGCCQYKKKNQQ